MYQRVTSLQKGTWRCWWQQAQFKAGRGQSTSWAHQTPDGQRGDCPAVLSTAVPSPGILCALLAPKCEKVFGEDGKIPEGIQRKATKLMKGIEGMSCGEWPRTPGLSSLERRRLRPPPCSLQIPEEGKCTERCWALLSGIQGEDTREWFKSCAGEV